MAAQVSASQLRYYLYLSDSKVESFASQLPKPVGAELLPSRFTVRISSLKLKYARNEEIVPSVYEKLEATLAAIEATGDVGSPGRPRAYFKGSLPMRWDTFSGDPSEPDSEMVCFRHFRRSGPRAFRAVILVGSARHLADGAADQLFARRKDASRHQQDYRQGFSYNVTDCVKAFRQWFAMTQSDDLVKSFQQSSSRETDEIATTIIQAAWEIRGLVQSLSFFARRLYSCRVQVSLPEFPFEVEVDMLLGTPFYVALKG